MRVRAAAIAILAGLLVGMAGFLVVEGRAPDSLSVLLWPGAFVWALTGGVHASPFNAHMDSFIVLAAGVVWAALVFGIVMWISKWRASRSIARNE